VDKPPPDRDPSTPPAPPARRGLAADLWDFARVNRKWWLYPILGVLLLVGGLLVLSATAAGPFIYTLF
jgi:hypothetical protein